jgi:hypothetical protein
MAIHLHQREEEPSHNAYQEKAGEFVMLEFKRMSCVTDKLHRRGKVSEREGLTRQPSLSQGPASRHHVQMDTVSSGPLPPLITSLQAWQPNRTDRTYQRDSLVGCIT